MDQPQPYILDGIIYPSNKNETYESYNDISNIFYLPNKKRDCESLNKNIILKKVKYKDNNKLKRVLNYYSLNESIKKFKIN